MDKKITHIMFGNAAEKYPGNIAIEQGTRKISYRELNDHANALGHALLHAGIVPGKVVATLFDNDYRNTIALISIFKVNGVYMPIGAQLKSRHWEVIKDQIRPEILITSPDFTRETQQGAYPFKYVIVVDSDPFSFRLYVREHGAYKDSGYTPGILKNPDVHVSPDDSSYIFFTSGTSGVPKAILGMHKSLAHFISWESDELAVTSSDRVSHLISNTFDASLRDIFLPLVNGGTLCIPEKSVRDNIEDLAEWMIEDRISIVHTVPSLFRTIAEHYKGRASREDLFPDMKYLLLAGEMLYNKDVNSWRAAFGSNTQIINLYGATETTMIKTFFRVGELTGELSDKVSAGYPISSTAVIIVNDEGKLCDINEVGEIYIRTPFVTKGYYNNEALTRQVFVRNPLTSDESDIVYKTGDQGKYLGDRRLMVLGRKDDVVKVNGIRIDLNDIESVVLGHGEVSEVKCTFPADSSQSGIICYYVAGSLTESQLREYCTAVLAGYEVPSLFVKLEKMPLLPNGKVDKAALPSIQDRLVNKPYAEPRNEVERKVADMWKVLLNRESVGVTDNFFELGGHSIKLIQLISKINREFGVKISPELLFNNPTVEAISEEIEKIKWANKKISEENIGDNVERFTV